MRWAAAAQQAEVDAPDRPGHPCEVPGHQGPCEEEASGPAVCGGRTAPRDRGSERGDRLATSWPEGHTWWAVWLGEEQTSRP